KFKYRVGQNVKYIGEDRIMVGKIYIIQNREVNKRMFKKDENVYKLSQLDKPNLLIKVTEQVLKAIIANPEGKKFITKIDERAKQIQKASGVLKTERVTFYNISRSKAKEQAFQELKK
ncbi:MAG: hypothetical protein H7339_08780, partial [Arcicella sp.]|nr:hypothetical protein [Arcicella sp.]